MRGNITHNYRAGANKGATANDDPRKQDHGRTDHCTFFDDNAL